MGSAVIAPAKSLETRTRIFDAAVESVARDGMSAVSVQTILRRAGQKNGGAIHYYFGSLDGLWDAIVAEQQQIVELDHRTALAAIDPSSTTMRDLVSVVVDTMARCLQTDLGRAYLSIQADRSFRNDWQVGASTTTLDLIRREMRRLVDVDRDSFDVRRRMGSRLIWQTFSALMSGRASDDEIRQTVDALVDAVTALAEPASQETVDTSVRGRSKEGKS